MCFFRPDEYVEGDDEEEVAEQGERDKSRNLHKDGQEIIMQLRMPQRIKTSQQYQAQCPRNGGDDGHDAQIFLRRAVVRRETA